jgi:AcrR family transcriptional regulator
MNGKHDDSTNTTGTHESRPYHHGDLRRVLLDEAVKAIEEVGAAGLSLRELARRAGVSHAAPAHHFGDKTGLLTAVATAGYELLASELRRTGEEPGSFLDIGIAYIRFALEHRAYFEIMFRPDLLNSDNPELREASSRASALLYEPLMDAAENDASLDVLHAGVAAWSLVHGFATLWLNGVLPEQLGDDPEQAARSVASMLFRPVPGISR